MSGHNNVFLLVIFLIFISAAIVQLFYYLYFYLSLYKHVARTTEDVRMPVSVIICARDEAENLVRFLPSVLEQDYPDYEVVVVNDCSEDHTGDVLARFSEKYDHLRVSTIRKDSKFTHNKKLAQLIGIKAAKNEILLFTDADCYPVSNKWIEGMTRHFNDQISFVLGFGGFLHENSFLNRYIHYDNIVIAMQYLGMAIRGIPYMGVGRNLAYRRSVFFSKKGFGPYSHLVSGDDDLFVNANATGSNTRVEFNLNTHTRSVPGKTLEQWLVQKKRHFTTARYYKGRDKLLLTAEPLSRMIFLTTMIILLAYTFLWPFVIAVFAIRLITQVFIFKLIEQKLNEPGMVVYSLFFDIFSPLMNSIVYLSNFNSRSVRNRWK